jgi:dTDP-4-amino-4,6-dideoxygalactose transaminase
MEGISQVANRSGLYIVEDNAQAHGASFHGRLTGSWVHVNGTSFYPGKNLGALGDAGAVTTHDDQLAKTLRTLRNYGSSKKYFNDTIGYNMRLDELQAALLSVKLRKIQEWTVQRQAIAELYDKMLTGIGDLSLPYVHPGATHVYHLYVIRTKRRDELQQFLSNAGIGTMIHYPVTPHLQKAYRHLGHSKGEFPIAETISETCLSIPLWPGLRAETVFRVAECIRSFFWQ